MKRFERTEESMNRMVEGLGEESLYNNFIKIHADDPKHPTVINDQEAIALPFSEALSDKRIVDAAEHFGVDEDAIKSFEEKEISKDNFAMIVDERMKNARQGDIEVVEKDGLWTIADTTHDDVQWIPEKLFEQGIFNVAFAVVARQDGEGFDCGFVAIADADDPDPDLAPIHIALAYVKCANQLPPVELVRKINESKLNEMIRGAPAHDEAGLIVARACQASADQSASELSRLSAKMRKTADDVLGYQNEQRGKKMIDKAIDVYMGCDFGAADLIIKDQDRPELPFDNEVSFLVYLEHEDEDEMDNDESIKASFSVQFDDNDNVTGCTCIDKDTGHELCRPPEEVMKKHRPTVSRTSESRRTSGPV